MNLQGRDLAIAMQGEDVAMLHSELQQLDLGVTIPEDAIQSKLFDDETQATVRAFQRTFGLTPTGIVDESTAVRINAEVDARRSDTFVVKGVVRSEDGRPFAGGLVRAFDKDMRSEEQLGEVTTDRDGRYAITYTAAKFQRAEKKSADLRVCACTDSGRELVSSPIIFNAQPLETVDLVIGGGVYRGPSEYERYVAELTPVMQGIPFAELKEERGDDEDRNKIKDITFLAGETGFDPLHIAYIVLAHRLAQQTNVQPETFYGFFRQALPTRLPSLLAQHPQVLRRSLDTALRNNIIPARLSRDVDSILNRLKELIVEHIFEESSEASRTSLSALLATSHPSRELQKAFLTSYVRHEGPIEDFWKALRQNSEFEGKVDNLQFTLQLGTLTWSHLPLVNELQRMKQAGTIGSFQDLTRFNADDWLEIIARQVDGRVIGVPAGILGENAGEKKQNYANGITRIIEEAFPTAAIASRIGKDDIPGKADLTIFFSNNPDFEFSSIRIDSYIAENADRLEGITDKDALTHHLKRMQRIYKLTPRYDEMQVMLADGLESARSIARMGKTAFITKYSEPLGGREQARRIYEKAHHATAMALTLFGKYGSVFHSTKVTPSYVDPAHIPGVQHPEIGEAAKAVIEAIPNWTTLFGSPALCECEHCRSAYGPAAYLVDTLWAFLKDIPSALDTLFSRRPDIEHIELSCDNTNTPLPYVDLVNEVLESAISPLSFSVGLAFQNDLDNGSIPPNLMQEFSNNGLLLSDSAAVVVEQVGGKWIIDDNGWRFTVAEDSGQLKISAWPQTSGTPEEVSANPEHLNPMAYDTLAQQVFPLDMPFNLWIEEARTYLEHPGVQRHQLMATFHQDPPPSEFIDIAIMDASLGLTTLERQIITETTPLITGTSPQPWEFWGLAENNNALPDPTDPTTPIQGSWIGVLSHVTVFLQRTGLSYPEVLELIGTSFTNPDKTIHIASTDPDDQTTCDLAKLQIANLTEDALGKMHRFVRLWRKLGWSIRALDQAITASGHSDFTGKLLQLSHIQRLHAELKNIPLVNMLSWWGSIDTARYDDDSKSLYERLFLNKAVMNPVDEAFNLDNLTSNPGKISDHVSSLLAALEISEADLSLLTKNEDAQAILHLPKSEITDDTLNLANLSHLYRIVSLANALKLSIRDFLLVKTLSGINPFDANHTEDTVRFVMMAQKIQGSGFQISELDYLLRHWLVTPSAGVAPTEESIALVLNEIRAGLQKIHEETAVAPDPTGEITSKNLTLLKWNNVLIEQVMATLDDSKIYESSLETLPSGIVFPDEVKNKVSYDSDAKKLRFTGAMTLTEKNILDGVTGGDPAYLIVVDALFQAPRTFVSQKMKVFEWPPFAAPVSVLPSSIVFPDALKNKIYYDPTDKEVRFVGLMTASEKASLLDLSGDSAYQSAINVLFDAPGNYAPEEKNRFLTSADASELFDASDTTVEQRFSLVLTKLLSYLRNSLSESLVKQILAEALKLEVEVIAQLLAQWVNSPTHPAQKSITEFLAVEFVGSNPSVKLTADSFPDQFRTFILLHKIATLLSTFNITPEQLRWLFEYGLSVGWLDLNALPLDPADSASVAFTGWERLVDLFQLRDQLPLGEATLTEIFALAQDAQTTEAALLQKLSERTGWKEEDLQFLVGAQGFGYTFPDAYKDEQALLRLRACFAVMKRLGVSAEQCGQWTKANLTVDDARSIKQAVKAKYDNDQWLTVAKPLRDVLREKQRSALVSYLIANPQLVGKDYLGNSNALYERFLIDVEMDPCMMTSRIKQAISSAQLFVQRCLMNLEEGITIHPQHARQWKWMKNYRVWEANRKVFLYPENWVEPELRDNKSPFFKDLENQLLQNEVTMDTVEDAFLNYLEKLDEVARLEIVGMYHQEEYPEGAVSESGDVRTGAQPIVNLLHVFGRTRGTPHIYYYRQWVNSSYWTPWEKVDVDIEGNHLIPVIWNRRLHLFWPIFIEKAKEEDPPSEEEGGKKPQKYWDIQIASSEYKNGKWSAKKISPMLSDLLSATVVEIILSFNAVGDKTKIFFKVVRTLPDLHIRFYYRTAGKEYLVFVYDFIFTGCDGTVQSREGTEDSRYLVVLLPTGTHEENMMFVEDGSSDDQLVLFEGDFSTFESYESLSTKKKPIPTLGQTPGTFHLLAPHQDAQFASQRPFFYQDDTRTFFVAPIDQKAPIFKPDSTNPILVDSFKGYYTLDQSIDPIGPVIDPVDPPIFEDSFPVEMIETGISATTDTIATGVVATNIGIATETNIVPLSTDSAPIALAPTTGLQSSSDVSDLLMENGTQVFEYAIPAYFNLKRFLFQTFYHPVVCDLIRQLKRDGIDGLLQRPNQFLPDNEFFIEEYAPTLAVVKGDKESLYPKEDVDFLYGGAYSLYNWELFFHVPLLVADRLSKNQRFEESQKWFHYIFDPTDRSTYDVPQRFWKVRPFFENSDMKKRLDDLLKLLARSVDDPTLKADPDIKNLVTQVDEWRNNPFNPHLIARLRNTAYQKTVVMKYLDNLIAWGDQLFRRDTIESINEATQLYILAAEILGKRPEKVPPRDTAPAKTYNQLEPELDAFSNALVQIENVNLASGEEPASSLGEETPLPLIDTLYFCLPKNDKLLEYWDTVADRLFKIRHCMTIEGIVRQLPLFEPPIDPALLVKAFAMGVDISSVLNDLNAPLPHYRFNVMVQKAIELCNDVKALGGALLSALEKRDAEELALMRSGHEIMLLDAIRQIKDKQIEEAKETLESLNKSKKVIEHREQYYRSREFMSPAEITHLALKIATGVVQLIGQGAKLAAVPIALAPGIFVGTAGTFGSPLQFQNVWEGGKVAYSSSTFGDVMMFISSILSLSAETTGTMAGYERRKDDWDFQAESAAKELEQIDKQIAAADIRVAIAEQELKNHDFQLENTKLVDEYMRNKFTNFELYNWMVSQIAAVYFQSYQLAYDLAKRTERAYRFELGLEDSNFIQFGYWDSLKKGLLTGEKLSYDLRRMEVAYLEQNKREYEITKHISLALLDPIALVKLKETGECFVNLPEAIYDLDYPGHYMRRMKSVSLSIPCITGPYTSVNCTLTLLRHSVRIKTTPTGNEGNYKRDENGDDPRFRDQIGAIQSIATSNAQNDSGVFELNFRDERYLPFEGAGAISSWRIELPQAFRQFDYDTISDVVLHLRYTAREGGGLLKQQVTNELQDAINEMMTLAENRTGLFRLFSVRHEFPGDWHQFLYPADEPPNQTWSQTLQLDLQSNHFPLPFRNKTMNVTKMELFLKLKDNSAYENYANGTALKLFLRAPDETDEQAITLPSNPTLNNVPHGVKEYNPAKNLGAWLLTAKEGDNIAEVEVLHKQVMTDNTTHHRLQPDAIEDLIIVCHYSV